MIGLVLLILLIVIAIAVVMRRVDPFVALIVAAILCLAFLVVGDGIRLD